MIHTLKDYIGRSLPQNQWFSTREGLRQKVSHDGKLLPYYGNTVVYLLDDAIRQQIRRLQETLYNCASDMLAEPLKEETFHMTVHDLVNGPLYSQKLQEQMQTTEQLAAQLLEQLRPDKPLKMKTTWMFNMVNTSIVLGLEPADEESYRKLDELYTALETVVPLGYALTPHITLAYFRPGDYAPDAVDRLRQSLRPVELELLLKPENLVLQIFRDMNTYYTQKQNGSSQNHP